MCAEKAGKQTIFPGRVLGLEFSNPGFGPGSGFHFEIFRVLGPGTRPVPIPDLDFQFGSPIPEQFSNDIQ